MQKKQPIPDLSLAAALHVLGKLRSWDLPTIALHALEAGWDSRSLVDLAALRDPIMAEAGPLLGAVLSELGIPMPSQDQAVHLVLARYIQWIAEGTVTPRDGLVLVEEVYGTAKLARQTKKYAGDSHGFHHLIGARWSYDDLQERPHEVSFQGKYGDEALAAFDAYVVQLAREWLTMYRQG